MRRLLVVAALFCALSQPAIAWAGDASSSSAGSHTSTPETKKSDKALARDVHRALGNTRGLDAQGIRVTARHGSITLNGTVRTVDEINTAEQVARSVQGVQAVSNRLTLFRGENG